MFDAVVDLVQFSKWCACDPPWGMQGVAGAQIEGREGSGEWGGSQTGGAFEFSQIAILLDDYEPEAVHKDARYSRDQ